jgi:hypothetical protein
MPSDLVPAKRFVPITARAWTSVSRGSGNPALTAFQLAPLFVVKKTPPPPVPAKRFLPITAKHWISVFVNPELTAFQLVPLFVDRKTPPPSVPANKFVPITARELIEPPSGPRVDTHWASDECGKVNKIAIQTRKNAKGLLI